MRWWQNAELLNRKRREERLGSTGTELARKYPVALALYAVLGILVWFTMGEGTIIVFGRPVEMRWIPIVILATFAFRTVMARQADKIRNGGE
jgi:hypothetical protein